jgi:hypothetical protein
MFCQSVPRRSGQDKQERASDGKPLVFSFQPVFLFHILKNIRREIEVPPTKATCAT